MASDQGPGAAKGTGTRAKNAPSTREAAPAADEVVEEESTPDEQPTTAAEQPSAKVKYTGGAGVRVITAAQWKGAGVENQATVTWDAGNDYTLPSSDFSADALEVLERDPNIKIK